MLRLKIFARQALSSPIPIAFDGPRGSPKPTRPQQSKFREARKRLNARFEARRPRWFSSAISCFAALTFLGLSGCVTPGAHSRRDIGVTTPPLGDPSTSQDAPVVRLQNAEAGEATGNLIPPPGPDPSPPSPAAPTPARTPARSAEVDGMPGLQGMNPIARNRAKYELDPDSDDKLVFPDLHADPLSNSHIPPEDRDPFLFPWLMNLIAQDRWRLDEDPHQARTRRLRRQGKIDIRDPDPDTANFPNGAFTIPKGRVYIENSPVGFYGPSKTQARLYQWEYLLRYGLTDNLELRIFSNGLTAQSARGKQPSVTGYSPLAFDLKIHFWEENTKYHIPAAGLEVYLQTAFGSPSLSAGTQPSVSLLFDQSLPFGVGFEYNFGISGIQNGLGQIQYQFSYQWSLQRQVVEDFDVFVHGFYNESGLPRLLQFRSVTAREVQSLIAQAKVPVANVVGVGYIWTVNDRLAVFGSYNFGTTTGSPSHIALMGFAIAM